MVIPVFEVQAYCNQFVLSVGFLRAKKSGGLEKIRRMYSTFFTTSVKMGWVRNNCETVFPR